MSRSCEVCGSSTKLSSKVGICADCARGGSEKALLLAKGLHAELRGRFGLPGAPPASTGGLRCNLCSNRCSMAVGESGYCGLRYNAGGSVVSSVGVEELLAFHYLDSHPTNCCSKWFCPGGTGAGYPELSLRPSAEVGYNNLAIFLFGCNFDCLYCQNWEHKLLNEGRKVKIQDLVDRTLRDKTITCWCFFGGSPEPQLPGCISASEAVIESLPQGRILRICFEWNGCGNADLVLKASEISLRTGGNVKFDLKCWSEPLSLLLSGVSNRRAFENFEAVARRFFDSREVPVITATTLLVPWYVDEEEVERIAEFISSIDDGIPYSLLVFHPDFVMDDLPVTPREQVLRCLRAAKRHLRRVNLGNVHLLG